MRASGHISSHLFSLWTVPEAGFQFTGENLSQPAGFLTFQVSFQLQLGFIGVEYIYLLCLH